MSVSEPTRIKNFAGGGGGGISLKWKGDAPLVEEFQSLLYLFESGSVNKIVAFLKIPENRNTTKQGIIKFNAFSSSITNSFLFTSTTYLIRNGEHLLDDATYNYVSTNAAIINTTPSKNMREVEIDITDSNGLIGGQLVEAGSTLRIELVRGSDSDTTDVKMVPDSTEVII